MRVTVGSSDSKWRAGDIGDVAEADGYGPEWRVVGADGVDGTGASATASTLSGLAMIVACTFGWSSRWTSLRRVARDRCNQICATCSGCVMIYASVKYQGGHIDATVVGSMGLMVTGPSVGWASTSANEKPANSGFVTEPSDPQYTVSMCGAFIVGGCFTKQNSGPWSASVGPGFGLTFGAGTPSATVRLF